MDSERCAALHNAIFEHGWISSGRAADAFTTQSRPWLELNPQAAQNAGFHPLVLAFLRKARALPPNHPVHFFYYFWGLHCELGGHEYCFPESDRTLTLHGTHPEHATQPDGLVYDQETHKAILPLDIADELEADQPWQKLESILIVWIEMIQRQKIVALPDAVGKTSYEGIAGGGVRRIEGPERDPVTGAKRFDHQAEPWTIVPWAPQDLEECLELWAMVVDAMEEKMGISEVEQIQHDGILDQGTLDAARVPDGFARRFLSQARRPRFETVAPGLIVPIAEDFTVQAFIGTSCDLEDEDQLPAILLFRNRATVSTSGLTMFMSHPHATSAECPSGLYLTPCDRSYRYPQEDGCSLILPFKFESGWARKSDFSRADQHDSLLQAGVNPYDDIHHVQLQAFLETVYRNIQSGHWTVDAHGIAGGLDVWRNADAEQHWARYGVPIGPGKYW
ncbi:hypothetical protein LTR85_003316 [Meristemomyces frigidus]|nr:hypothetical protein LTR85_003316 [Meristemomyces frigidus]